MRDSERRLARTRIFDVVRGVRWRWRTRQILRGLVWVGGLTGLVVFAGAFGHTYGHNDVYGFYEPPAPGHVVQLPEGPGLSGKSVKRY